MSTLQESIKNNIFDVRTAGLYAYKASYSNNDYDRYYDYGAFGNFTSGLSTVVNITGTPGIFQLAVGGNACERVVVTLDGVEYDLTVGGASSAETALILPRLFPQGMSGSILSVSQAKSLIDLSPAVVFQSSLKVQVSGGGATYANGARVCAKVGEEWLK